MEDKLKYFLIGVMMLLVILMYNDSFGRETSVSYVNCTHEYTEPQEEYTDEDGVHHDAVEGGWSGGWEQESETEYWWFQYSDLIECKDENGNRGPYYCMFAGHPMRSFHTKDTNSENDGWLIYDCGHEVNDHEQKFWHTNVHFPASFGKLATFKGVAACAMYNYKIDSNSPNKRGKLGVQAVIWDTGSSATVTGGDIGGGLDESHFELICNDGETKNTYIAEMKFFALECGETYTGTDKDDNQVKSDKFYIKDVEGESNKRGRDEGLLPGERFVMTLNFPILFGTPKKITTDESTKTTTYEGEFGKISIKNGTLAKNSNGKYAIPENKSINKSGEYKYTIEINTGDLTSNKVEIEVEKWKYDYSRIYSIYRICSKSYNTRSY